MSHPSIKVIEMFFEACAQRNMDELKQILAENVWWVSFEQAPYSSLMR